MGRHKALESGELYTVGWIVALAKELTAALAMLDERHDEPEDFVHYYDTNVYRWGRIGDHNVVIASPAAGVYGTTSAATTAIHMLSSFPSIKVGLMIGIGAAIPGPKHDIRLGDVVVSLPQGQTGGVVQYDFGKSRASRDQGHTPNTFERVEFLNPPPEALLKALTSLRAQVRIEGSRMSSFLEDMLERYPRMAESESDEPGYIYQGQDNDRLFETSYLHTSKMGCDNCDPAKMVARFARRNPDAPRVHYGVIASGSRLVKDAAERDQILEIVGSDCICLEMEAAGLMTSFPCLVIRGICDYADSHKNDDWQEYAAATAAAYAKEFLGFVDNGDLARTAKASEMLKQGWSPICILQNLPADRDTFEDIRQTNTNVEAIRELQFDHHNKEIRNWLSAPDPSTNYVNALEKRHEGTGLWFTHGEALGRWKRQPDSFLWVHGIAGSGKTVLSSTIIEHLKSDIRPEQALLYFYFDVNDPNKQTLENMLRSLTAQLYQGQLEARGPVDELWNAQKNNHQQPSEQSLNTVLLAMLSKVRDTCIVLDALDETSTQSDILAWLKIVHETDCSVRILVTARREESIESALRDWTQPDKWISIQGDDVDEDIRAYITHIVQHGKELDRWQSRPDVQHQIESELVEKANGMFRWVACQIDALKDCFDYPTLQWVLRNLPKNLDDTYARILENIPEEHIDQTMKILNILVWSSESWAFSVSQMMDAIAINLDEDPGFDPNNRIPISQEVLKLCSSLVMVSKVSRKDDDEYLPDSQHDNESIDVIRLTNRSVKDYLMSDNVSKISRSMISGTPARAYLARACLTYLIRVSQLSKLSPDEVISLSSIDSEYPLAEYCGLYWMEHARGIERKDENLWKLMTSLVLERPKALSLAKSIVYLRTVNTISYASWGGLTQLVELLMNTGAQSAKADTTTARGHIDGALQLAARKGHDATVQLLLNGGADVDVDDALQAASVSGHYTTVRLLVDRGADVNARDGVALQAASKRGHYAIVQLLLGRDATLSLQDFIYALRRDDQKGERVVSIMLPYVTAELVAKKDEEGRNILHHAAICGSEAVVQRCLDLGADVHARDHVGKTALHLAAESGNAAVIQMLVRAGSDVTTLNLAYAQDIASTFQSAKDGKSLVPASFEAALDTGNVVEALRLLEEETEAITQPTSGFEWLKEPLAMGLTPIEIIDLILEERNEAPWIRYELPTFEGGKLGAEFHRQNCVHDSDFRNASQDQQQRGLMRETIDRTVAEMCGLGGVVPLLRARSSWGGIVSFSDTIAKVIFRDTDATEVLVSDAGEVKQLAQRSLDALGRVTMLVAWLQSNDLICDSFVILKHEADNGYIEAVNIPFRLVAELETHLQRFINSQGERDTFESEASVLKTSMTLLELFCHVHPRFNAEDSRDIVSYTIDVCAVAVQAICIGLLAFSQAHLGELHPFFLMHTVSHVWLCGTGGKLSTQMSLSLQLRELSCLGDMLASPVMVFSHGKQQTADKRLNLLTSLENLFELWGSGQVVVDYSSYTDRYIRGVLLGGGLIYSSSHDFTMFHWSQGLPEEVMNFTHETNISAHDLIVIGGFQVNQDCPFKKAFDKSMPRMDTASQPHMLGTFGEFWSLREVQYGSQAGQYALVAINMTWVKTEARTIKSAINNGDWDLSTLEAPWGLLVSVCTGVAQRVPLREVVAEVMPSMVASMRKRPREWELLAQNHNIVEKSKDPAFKTWFSSLKGPEQDALDVVTEYILKKMYWTGVNQREKLVVACPSFENPSGCIHMPREQNQALASILKDSEDCATYASVTTKCIETDDQKCRNSHKPTWQDRASLLITSVCQYQQLKTGKRQKLYQQGLQDGKQYWMGYIRDYRRFTAQVQSASGSSIVLKISDSKCPVGWARLAWERVDRTKSCYIRLVERQLVNEEGAEEVFVLSGE
ncbi:purine and uridine phosphorylase, partial [Aureobasidium melanogenum]